MPQSCQKNQFAQWLLSLPKFAVPILQNCILQDLGRLSYKEAWDLQLELFHQKIAAKAKGVLPQHHLLLVEHPHVYTFGKSAEKSNLLATPEMLRAVGAEVYEIERGGDITYHGPGQLVAYPIFDLEQLGLGVKAFVQSIEASIIQTLAEFQINSVALSDRIGVWMDVGRANERKIAAIGIKCSRYVSMHGLALNVNTDLNMFNHIVPCGIPDKGVTSMARENNSQIDMENVKSILGKQFAHIFGLNFTT
jgi:lipoyl(octanoyl) transferase